MATIEQLLDNVSRVLGDEDQETWVEADLIDWLNDAILALLSVRPDASQVNAVVTLVPGTKQTVPVTHLRLLRVIRNMGVDGLTVGRAVLESDLETQDAIDPDWHAATAAVAVNEFLQHPDEPRVYYVNPPVHASTVVQVEASFSSIPTKMAAVGDTLPVDEVYAPALQEWILYQCLSVDSEDTPSHERAILHRKSFFELLGVKQIIEEKQENRGKADAP